MLSCYYNFLDLLTKSIRLKIHCDYAFRIIPTIEIITEIIGIRIVADRFVNFCKGGSSFNMCFLLSGS
jgi:hypothetical protein